MLLKINLKNSILMDCSWELPKSGISKDQWYNLLLLWAHDPPKTIPHMSLADMVWLATSRMAKSCSPILFIIPLQIAYNWRFQDNSEL